MLLCVKGYIIYNPIPPNNKHLHMLKVIKCKNYAKIYENLIAIFEANKALGDNKKFFFANTTLFDKSEITPLSKVVANINERCIENSIYVHQVEWEGSSKFVDFQNKLIAILEPNCDVILLTLSNSKKFDAYVENAYLYLNNPT